MKWFLLVLLVVGLGFWLRRYRGGCCGVNKPEDKPQDKPGSCH